MNTIKGIVMKALEIVVWVIYIVLACVLSAIVFLTFYGLIKWFVTH